MLGLLVVCFSVPLFQLTRFALSSELYSYIVLIPFISAYLIWTKREHVSVSQPAPRHALAFGIGAVVLL
ncbi:MAG: archaeosortase/exosortase family protein, partial [Verrucomicrobiota bacterium]